jgi:transcriptional regulator with XRE-family HTH domain
VTGWQGCGGLLRRIRRVADLSQRELAAALDVHASQVARFETGEREVPVTLLVQAAALAGLRLALLDGDGREVAPMTADGVRDRARRRFPAHLDTRHGDEDWWYGPERYGRRPPRYTFDRDRRLRDRWRDRDGTPDDHLEPRPEDDLAHRAELRARAAWEKRQEARQRLVGTPRDLPELEPCTCLPTCEDLLEAVNRHAEDCPCGCDVA